ncbi:MAG: hypothetical protein IOMNBAOH_02809 [Rhodocyclaceae bacterium]|nr:hypothetical protein [Rhodocyclaceae bacterium]
MESRAHALMAGAFMLILALGAFFAYRWLRGSSEPVSEYVLVTRGHVSGLNPQAQVRYRGIRVGKVSSIDLNPKDPGELEVRIQLPVRYPLTRGTRAKLNMQGITGLAYVMLEDDQSDPRPLLADPGAAAGVPPRIALRPSRFDNLDEQVADLAQSLRGVLGRVTRVLSDENIERLSAALGQLERASTGIADAAVEAPRLVADLRRFTSEKNLERINAILANLEQTSSEAAPLTADLRRMVQTLDDLARRIETVGTRIGRDVSGETLPQLNRLLGDLTQVTRRFGRTLEALDAAPQSLLFGRTDMPGPGEPGFRAP